MRRKASRTPASVISLVCDGRVRLERRTTSRYIHARAFIQGRLLRKTTGTSNLREAKRVATEWWSELLTLKKRGEIVHAPTFTDCAKKFLATRNRDAEEGTISRGQYQQLVWKEALLRPYIGHLKVASIDAQTLLELRAQRETRLNNRGERLTNSTLKKDLVFVHSVLVFAKNRLRVIEEVPPSPPFTGSKAIVRRGRPFLAEAEYKKLHQLAKSQAEERNLNPRTRRQRLSLYYYILISVGGALRVSEAESVRWCDCYETQVISPDGGITDAVLMYVLGKHSRGGSREKAYVMFGGEWAYRQMKQERPEGTSETDLLFPESHREGMKKLLTAAGLYEFNDPETGRKRTRDRKSLRPTAITLRLDKGDNVSYRAIAEWARTSPVMIEEFYDQLHPAKAAGEVATFRKKAKPDAEADDE